MRFETLGEQNFEAFRCLAEQAWRRPGSPEYYRWRYFDAPSHTTLLALEGEQCLASVSWFERSYRVGGATLTCLEPFDWYASPQSRRSAAGLRLMKHLQKLGKPILGFGGSDHTQKMLPKLGFRPAGEGTLFVLPLTGAHLLQKTFLPAIARRILSPAVTAAMSLRFRAPAVPGGLEARRVPRIDDAMAQMSGPAGFVALPEPAHFDWLEKGAAAGARTGQYIFMEVAREGSRVGWGVGRLYRVGGLMRGAIVELRLARADATIADAAVRGMTRILARSGADNVRVWSQLPVVADACRRAGFRATSERAQAMIWSGRQPLMVEGADLCRIADAAFFPLHDASPTASAPARLRPRPGLTGAA